MKGTLPREMQQHTYAIMDRIEDRHWWFVGRRAILESFMQRMTERLELRSSASTQSGRAKKAAGIRILDVGCGTGANLDMLSRFGNAEGVDVSEEALEYCRKKGLNVHEGLAEDLPFEDDTFDITTALDVIEHLDDDMAGITEIHRVTKKGGYSLIFVPAFMWLWGVQDDISNHRIRYTKTQIVERLGRAGFKVERATYANFTFFAPILAGRAIMRLTGIRPESENNVNVSVLNGIFGKMFSAERVWLRNFNFPIGVSIIVVAKKNDR